MSCSGSRRRTRMVLTEAQADAQVEYEDLVEGYDVVLAPEVAEDR